MGLVYDLITLYIFSISLNYFIRRLSAHFSPVQWVKKMEKIFLLYQNATF